MRLPPTKDVADVRTTTQRGRNVQRCDVLSPRIHGVHMRAVRHWQAYLKLDPASPWAGIARRQLKSLLHVTPGGAG